MWEVFTRYVVVGSETEVKTGFVQRTDLRRTDLFLRRSFRPGRLNIRKVDFYLGGNLFTGIDGTKQDWSFGPIIPTEFESGDQLTFFFQDGENRPDEEFNLADSLHVPAGTYDGKVAMVMAATSPSRPVVLDGTLRVGNFYGGTMVSLGGTLSVAPSPRISLGFGLSQNRVDLPSGEFTANLVSLKGTYSFSTRFSTNLLVQYNSLDEYFSTNLRVNFIHRPGSDLFLVFTEERGVDGDLWEVSNRGLVMKLTYLKRF